MLTNMISVKILRLKTFLFLDSFELLKELSLLSTDAMTLKKKRKEGKEIQSLRKEFRWKTAAGNQRWWPFLDAEDETCYKV